MQLVHPRLHSLLEVTFTYTPKFKWKHTLPSPLQCADLLLRMIIPYLQQKQGQVHIFYLASRQGHCHFSCCLCEKACSQSHCVMLECAHHSSTPGAVNKHLHRHTHTHTPTLVTWAPQKHILCLESH